MGKGNSLKCVGKTEYMQKNKIRNCDLSTHPYYLKHYSQTKREKI